MPRHSTTTTPTCASTAAQWRLPATRRISPNIQFATNGSSNLGKYSNAEVDALIKTLNATQDTEARNELARQIAQQVLDDTSFIFFANPDACVIARKGVTGLDAAPSEYYFVTVDADVQ